MTDMRLRRSGSLKGAQTVEASSCYRNFSKCKYAAAADLARAKHKQTGRGGGWEKGLFVLFFFFLAANRRPSPCPASLDGSFVA